MHIDDIFNPAIQGDVSLLESRLQQRAVDLNQMIDGGENNGMRSAFPLLFSVLYHMSVNGVNHDVLELLVKYGADVNAVVTLDSQESFMRIPLLAYVIDDWNSEEMTEFLLRHGANPGAVKEIVYPGGYTSTTPMLYFAISTNRLNMLELLLRYGADPNQYADVFIQQGGYYQYLPPIYYALVEQENSALCVMLFKYGASPQATVELGKGLGHKTNLQQYINLAHPHLSNMLVSTFERAQASNVPSRVHSEGEAPQRARRRAAQPQQEEAAPVKKASYQDEIREQGRPKEPAPKVNSLRRCYGKFTAYLFGNFGILAVAFMIIAPLCFIGRDAEMALIFFVLGLPFAGISALVWLHVSRKAKKRGQVGVMGTFVLDSLLMFARVLMIMLIITIPLVKMIGSNIQWEERRTSSGRSVRVKKTGEDEYEDASGNRYTTRD